MKKRVEWSGLHALAATALVLLVAGCGNDERVTTNTVLANNNCKGILEPIKRVSLAEVAGYRGSQLLQPNGATVTPKDQDRGQEHAAIEPNEKTENLPLFIALSRGVQPSRGFE